jgi:ubiquinone/menaquinone biosynthesis C-methylase UbiE
VSFEVPAESYDRFMGRYSTHLSAQLADLAGIVPGMAVLDVGCGPGALTGELLRRLGAAAVSAVDPSERFVEAIRERHPGVTVERGAAEQLPFADASFDAALAQLVVHFMKDPVAGLREMVRATRSGGPLAACVWDHAPGGQGPLMAFHQASHEVDPRAPADSGRAGTRQGHLGELFREAGIAEVEETAFMITVVHPTFDDWWEPFTLGVGPTSAFFADLGPEKVEQLRLLCREALGPAPITVNARAWAARGVAP